MITRKELEKIKETKRAILCPVCQTVIMKTADYFLQCKECGFKLYNFDKKYDKFDERGLA